MVHVPAGTFAFGGDTRLDSGFLAQQIEGAPAPGALRARHILRAMATADAAVVLPEADIQDPMQAGGGPEGWGLRRQTGNEIPDFSGGLLR